jgi:hypothetical protein
MFVRMSPYLPFSARVCLNQHQWLAVSEGVDLSNVPCSNAFLKCSDPGKLQELADSLTAQDLLSCGQKWLACLTPNRTIGQPKKITMIFGRKVTKQYKGKLQTIIEDVELPNPVIRSHYGKGFLKQYVRDHLCLRTETATNDVTDYGVKKAVENLPQLGESWRPSATIISPSSPLQPL